MAQRPTGAPAVIEFGPFRFDPVRRTVADGNGPLRLGSRALQILHVLLENPGRLYSREELVERVWPQTVVEETSLRVHMSALRRALGDGVAGARYIANVPGRGYSFVAEARKVAAGGPASSPKQAYPPGAAQALSSRLTRSIGRDQVIVQLRELMAHERLVSIVGAGGMGKTTVALSVAEGLQSAYADGVFLVDLSRLSDPAFVAVEVGQTQGLNMFPGDPPTVLEAALRDRHALLVIDNCEHVIDAVASLVHRLLQACPFLHLLATSREPLEVETERVFKLPALAVPGPHDRLDVADLLDYPALQLFVERAKASCDTFELTEATAPAVRQVCEFLDGIPLAIELAAARVDSLGVQGLAGRLESVFDLLTRGRRTALSRHRTLQAVLDWSHDLLGDTEKLVLQRLSVFRGAFDLEGAVTVACCPRLSRQRVIDDVLSLCAKSLLVLEATGEHAQLHRLLYITRLYAERHLARSADAPAVHRRHAAFILDGLLRTQQADVGMSQYSWSPALGSTFADLRAAIGWAMVQENDLTLGLELTASAKRTYCDVGYVEEYREHLSMALAKVGRAAAERERLELGLRVASNFMYGYVVDGSVDVERAFARTRSLVDDVGSTEDRIESLFGMCIGTYGQGDYHAALAHGEQIRQLATGDFAPLSVAICDRLSVLCLHALGDHDAAESLARRVMAFNGARIGRKFLSEVPFGVSMRMQLARIHWLRADFALAWSTMLEALALSEGAHVFARCQVIGMVSIPMAIWKGETALADQWVNDLLEMSEHKQLVYWQAFARAYRLVVDGEDLRLGSRDAQVMDRCAPLGDIVATLQARPPRPSTLRRVERSDVGWCAPEVRRLACLADLDTAQQDRAVAGLQQGMRIAKAQGARFWMLRIALTVCSGSLGGEFEENSFNALRSIMVSKDDGSAIPELAAGRLLLKGRA